jgi:hypothetical protein
MHGVGIIMNVDSAVQVLSDNGIKHARVEIAWGRWLFTDESRMSANDSVYFATVLQSLQRHGIRPLILLNGHHGWPCPARWFKTTVLETAPLGQRWVRVDSAAQFSPKFSGLSNITAYIAAQLITDSVVGDTVWFGKALPKKLTAGEKIGAHQLKYMPFTGSGQPFMDSTLQGFARYAENAARFARQALGNTDGTDAGFDMEIWNEMSFGSDFIFAKRYYDSARYVAPEPYALIVQADCFRESSSMTVLENYFRVMPKMVWRSMPMGNKPLTNPLILSLIFQNTT